MFYTLVYYIFKTVIWVIVCVLWEPPLVQNILYMLKKFYRVTFTFTELIKVLYDNFFTKCVINWDWIWSSWVLKFFPSFKTKLKNIFVIDDNLTTTFVLGKNLTLPFCISSKILKVISCWIVKLNRNFYETRQFQFLMQIFSRNNCENVAS